MCRWKWFCFGILVMISACTSKKIDPKTPQGVLQAYIQKKLQFGESV